MEPSQGSPTQPAGGRNVKRTIGQDFPPFEHTQSLGSQLGSLSLGLTDAPSTSRAVTPVVPQTPTRRSNRLSGNPAQTTNTTPIPLRQRSLSRDTRTNRNVLQGMFEELNGIAVTHKHDLPAYQTVLVRGFTAMFSISLFSCTAAHQTNLLCGGLSLLCRAADIPGMRHYDDFQNVLSLTRFT